MAEVAPKDKIDKPKKKLPLPRKRYVLGFFSIVLICGAVAYLLLRDTRQVVDCNAVIDAAGKNLSEEHFQEGVTNLKKYKALCAEDDVSIYKLSGQPLSNENKLVYLDLLTQLLYKSGDKEAAKNLANDTLSKADKVRSNINNTTTDEFVKISESLKRAYMLKADRYYETPKDTRVKNE